MTLANFTDHFLGMLEELEEEFGADAVQFSMHQHWEHDTDETDGHDLDINLEWEDVTGREVLGEAEDLEEQFPDAEVSFNYRASESEANVNITWTQFDQDNE